MTINPIATVQELLVTARKSRDRIAAARAVEPLLTSLKATLKAAGTEGGPPPMIRTWSPSGPRPGEPIEQTAARLSFRIDEIALARRWGDATDVQRTIDLALGELRQAALAGEPGGPGDT